MTKISIAICALLLTACGTAEKGIKLIPQAAFETSVDGKQVSLYTLQGGEITMQVTNYGARVVSLWTPDRSGTYEDIVLGYDSISRYVDNNGERFLGAVVGPYANRIANGTFTLDGEQYNLPINNNDRHTLHGGMKGLDCVVWDVVRASEQELVLSYTHADNQEGFPGNLNIRMTYSLTPQNEFRIDYHATTDKATVVNISHHSFFNLKGAGNGTICDNILQINASNTTPVDSLLIPTGEIADVSHTPFDFRTARVIAESIDQDNAQIKNGKGYDHNWVIDDLTPGVKQMATLYEPTTGRIMEVWSDQPALQFYSGNFFDGSTIGKYGKPLRYRESMALETQKYPDSPNHETFPSTLLLPQQEYTHICIYKFATK